MLSAATGFFLCFMLGLCWAYVPPFVGGETVLVWSGGGGNPITSGYPSHPSGLTVDSVGSCTSL